MRQRAENRRSLPEELQPEAAQRRASDPAASAWVGASAGSGKTKVLADRVVRLLLDGIKPQKILCLTFTRAAAAEMAIRITQQLGRWATCDDDALRRDLDDLQGAPPAPKQLDEARRLFARVLSCPGGMRIRTIHAFGQEILRRFPLEAGLPPHFVVLDEPDAQVLQREAQDDLLQAAAAGPNSREGKALQTLVRDLGEDSFTAILREATKDPQRLNAALEKAGGLPQLIAHMRGLLALAPDEDEATLLRRGTNDKAVPCKDLLYAAQLLCDKGSKKYKARGQVMLDWLAMPQAARVGAFEAYARAFLTAKYEPFDDVANKEILAAHPDVENILGREAARLMSLYERLDTVHMADQTAAVLTLCGALNERYAARKAVQAALDYDDLIRRTNALLHRHGIAPWVLFKLDGGVDHILVDEAQDTSPEQWQIIATLADEFFAGSGAREGQNRTLFIVGDEKQSIYSFLKADPDEFARMREHFRQRITAALKDYNEVPMNVSFRSAPAVLRAVDAVFEADAARQGVAHTPITHHPFRREAAGHVEVWPLLPAHEKEKTETDAWELPVGYEPERDPAAELAGLIAKQIQQWVKDGLTIYDRAAKQDRLLLPGDVMILVRRRDRFVDHLVRKLKDLRVPVTGVDRMQLTSQLAVMDLMALLQFSLLPEDDLTLATVLRGPLLGCSEEQLMALAIDRKGALWQSLLEKAENDAAFVPVRDYLQRCLAAADKVSPFAMLARLLNEPCPADEISGRRALLARLGPDAQDPIDELLNAAQDFSARHTPSLQAFLHWLNAAESEIKREMDHGAGRVRITTVHAAKGLEAPIVILPDTTSTPRKNDLPKFLWHPDYHLPFYVPRDPANAMLRALRDTARQKQMEEYRRLFYVALTRAADRLYVCGYETARQDNADESWYALISGALKTLHEPSSVPKKFVVKPAIVLADPPLLKKETRRGKKSVVAKTETPLPAWAFRPPPPEPTPPRPLTPSRASEDEPPMISPRDELLARGRIIHRLLQSLPDVTQAEQEKIAARFLANPQHNLTQAQQTEISREVLALLKNTAFEPLFGPNSRAEVPIVGRIGNNLIAGQVDRLCVKDDSVWIVDYKTNRPPPESVEDIPTLYRKQLAAYRAVLQEIYPDKDVRCFLLWTYGPRLMEVPFLAIG